MIQEGCDVGIMPGKFTDERKRHRTNPRGKIVLHLAPRLAFFENKPSLGVKEWSIEIMCHGLSLSGSQSGAAEGKKDAWPVDEFETDVRRSPVLISEWVPSIRRSRAGGIRSAVAGLLIADEIRRRDLVPGLPKWKPRELHNSRRLCRKTRFADARERVHRLLPCVTESALAWAVADV